MNRDYQPEFLKRLYFEMLRIRSVEEHIAAQYPEQQMRCPVHLSIGQEAVAVGVCAALSDKDYALSGHRCHAHYLAKGGRLKPMIAEIFGKATGCCKGKGGSMHLVDLSVKFLGAAPIVGSTIPIAVGVAMGSVMLGEEAVTVVFLGDGATEEGVFHESVNFAALKNLPVLFLCENNFYSVYSPLSVRQPGGREIISVAAGHGIESRQGNGNDVLEVHEMTAQAVASIRENKRPVFLEFKTYRWREHCGPNYDNDIGYRTEEEFRNWRELCPLAGYERALLSDGIISGEERQSMTKSIAAEIEEAFRFAKASPFPEQKLLLQEVFAS